MAKKLSASKVNQKLRIIKSQVRLADLSDAIYASFGSPQAFAEQWKKDFEAAAAGSVARMRLLDGFLKLVQHISNKDNEVTLDDLTTEELEAETAEMLRKCLKATPIDGLTVEDADAAPPTAT